MQCYQLLYYVQNGTTYVLIGTKNVSGTKLHGKSVSTMVWNYGGQAVIPGGKKEQGETAETAARREFFEETGIDFRQQETQKTYGAGPPTTKTLTDKNKVSFSITYQKVDPDQAAKLAAQINDNITKGTVQDDEQHDVAFVSADAALTAFTTVVKYDSGWRKTQYNALDSKLKQRADEQLTKQRDWFELALKHLPQS